jgi:SAM-dependent methyltransferase
MFTTGTARRSARAYRRKGLDGTARKVLDAAVAQGIAGASVLEVGGGVGGLHLELLRRGAARATNLELSPAYEREAAELLAQAGMTGRVDRRLLDIAEEPDAVEPADVVVLHRVVCCYPDHRRLLTAAADRARRVLVLSYPLPRATVRMVLGTQNLVHRVLGQEFRVFARPPAALLGTVAERGLRVLPPSGGAVWQVACAVRE